MTTIPPNTACDLGSENLHWISLEPCTRFWEDFALYCYEHNISVADTSLLGQIMQERYGIERFYSRPANHALAGFKSAQLSTMFTLKWT